MKAIATALCMQLAVATFATAPGRAQGLAEDLRAGGIDAVEAAVSGLTLPDEADVNGLLAIMQGGTTGKSPAPQAAELAYAVIGWWSIQDSGIANGLLDRFESNDWPKLEKELFELATMGATDGMQRAARWFTGSDKRLKRHSLHLMRCVGGDKKLIDQAIKQTLTADRPTAEVTHALRLMWEFQVATQDLREQLEARVAAAKSWDEKMLCVWAMVRGGAFRVDWLVSLYSSANAQQRRCIDEAMPMAADTVPPRLVQSLKDLPDDASRQIVIDWIANWRGSSRVRAALRTAGQELNAISTRMIDVALASAWPPPNDLLPHWHARLRDEDPELQRVACQALVNYRAKAAALIPQLRRVLEQPLREGSKLHSHAITALAAIGSPAKHTAALLQQFADGKDQALAAKAKWALPMVRGEELYKTESEGLAERLQRSWRWRQRQPKQLPAGIAPTWATKLAEGTLTAEAALKNLSDYCPLRTDAVPLLLLAKARDGRAQWFDVAHSWLQVPKASRLLIVPRLLTDLLNQMPMTEHQADVHSKFAWGSIDRDISLHDGEAARNRPVSPRDADLRLLHELQDELQPALPLLQWLAPRRTDAFRRSLAAPKQREDVKPPR